MPVLDATLLIQVEQGADSAKRSLERLRSEGASLLLPAQVAAEYLAGMEDKVAELATLHSAFEVVHTTDAQILETARLVEDAVGRRVKPRWADAVVAAVAVLEGTYVVTANKRHFTQLRVPAWNYETEPDPPQR